MSAAPCYNAQQSMSNDTSKAALERAAFVEFASLAGLPVLAGTVESRPPPEPDIVCEIDGRGRVAFELVTLFDEDLARMLAQAVRGDLSTGTWFGDPSLESIRVKCTKKDYQTQHPIELVAWGDDTLLPYNSWAPSFEQRLKDLVNGSPFQRLWAVNLSPPRGAACRVIGCASRTSSRPRSAR